MKQGQKYLGTVSEMAIKYGCYEQLMDGQTILTILRKRKFEKGYVRSLPNPDEVKVYASSKMTTCGGRAYYNSQHIAVHTALVESDKLKSEFCITMLHEFAHLVAYGLYKERGHGNAWRYVMDVLDLPPNMYHSNVRDFAAHKAAKSEEALDELMDLL